MIHSLIVRHENFTRTIPFHKGLNLVVGNPKSVNNQQASCNSIGKSTMLMAIDFCLGSDVNKQFTLPASAMGLCECEIDIDIFGSRVRVIRQTINPVDIEVIGDVSGWPIKPDMVKMPDVQSNRPNGSSIYQLENWRMLLGSAFFDLNLATDNESTPVNGHQPSYRQLMAYFHRLPKATEPLTPTGTQKASVYKEAIAYLLGLNWKFVNQYDTLDVRERNAAATKNGATTKMHEWKMSVTSLKKDCKRLKQVLEDKKKAMADFKVDPLYSEKEAAANALSEEISTLRRRIVTNRRNLANAKASLANEESVSTDNLKDLYEEVSVHFPSAVLESLQRVEDFHKFVTTNRRDVLKNEIAQLSIDIKRDEGVAKAKDDQRSVYLKHLEEHHALDALREIQGETENIVSDLAVRAGCLEDYNEALSEIKEIKAAKKDAIDAAKEDFDHLTSYVAHAENTFSMITQTLYQHPGSLGIEFKEGGNAPGFFFKPTINGDSGSGVGKAAAIAFDLTLLLQLRSRKLPLDFIMHDGELLVSSEKRQRTSVLKLVHALSLENDCQYFTGLNYDMLPEEDPEYNLDEVKVLELHDESDEGRLFGFYYDPKTKIIDKDKDTTDEDEV